MTIELVSSTNPYLYLMSGAGTSGTELAKNDDSRDNDLGRRNSRIVYEASAGTYTAESTTWSSMRTGDFHAQDRGRHRAGCPQKHQRDARRRADRSNLGSPGR